MGSRNRNLTGLVIFLSYFPWSENISAQAHQSPDSGCSGKQIEYSDFDFWYERQVRESSIIGGNKRTLYEIGRPDPSVFNKNVPVKDSLSPWATTNLYARIGVDVGVACVFPEKTDDGYCCRMESKIREVNLIGLKMKVLVSGTIFLGETLEPVQSLKDPVRGLNHGVPFTEKPKAIQFSYKYKSGAERIRSVYSSRSVAGTDKGEFCLILQRRWEDEKGQVYATRIGGARDFLTTAGWVTDTLVTIKYGDISGESFYDPQRMGLIPAAGELYVKNSKNEMVPLIEKGWAGATEKPTHIVLYFTSSFEGIDYTGAPGSVLWVDNISFVY